MFEATSIFIPCFLRSNVLDNFSFRFTSPVCAVGTRSHLVEGYFRFFYFNFDFVNVHFLPNKDLRWLVDCSAWGASRLLWLLFTQTHCSTSCMYSLWYMVMHLFKVNCASHLLMLWRVSNLVVYIEGA